MKKILFAIIFIFISNLNVFGMDLYSENVILYNYKDDRILFEKNSNDEVYIASLTKVVTVLVALENISDVNEKVILSADVFDGLYEEGASVANFYIGEELTYDDLLYGAMLPSGADATRGLAINLFGSEDNFVLRMNDFARRLKLDNTVFVNTTGLDQIGAKSTANDFLKVMLYAFENDYFMKIFSSKSYTISNNRLTFYNSMVSLANRYDIDIDNVDGAKTGFTDNAGLCLVSYNKEDSLLLITLGAPVLDVYFPNHILDAKDIYNHYLDNYSYLKVVSSGDVLSNISLKYSKKEMNNLIYRGDDVTLYLPNDSVFKYSFDYSDDFNFLKNKPHGEVSILLDDVILAKGYLYVDDFSLSFAKFLKHNFYFVLGFIFIIFLFRLKKKT